MSFVDLHLVQDTPNRPVRIGFLGSNLETDPQSAQRR
jgi:hypothetical protein